MFQFCLLSSVLLATLQTTCYAAPTSSLSTRQNQTSDLIYITLEEHYDPAAMYPELTDPVFELLAQALPPTPGELAADPNITGPRLESMDANNIRIQVMAADPTPPALRNVSVVQASNNQLHAAVQKSPSRFRGFCFLPMAYPDRAAVELERCVSQLGFVGALVDSHTDNETFYDDPAYDVLWSMAQKLDVPIYLHPTYPLLSDVNSTTGRFKPSSSSHQKPDWSLPIAATLATSGFGWHVDTGLTFLRLWLGGVFDRYPHLKIVLGHMGETIPYMLDRAQFSMGYLKPHGVTVIDAYNQNVWVTTSGFFSLHPFATLASVTAKDRIMFSVDYPWAANENGTAFMDTLKKSGVVTEEEWKGIAYGNAERLLKL